jgi:hypothetical protein
MNADSKVKQLEERRARVKKRLVKVREKMQEEAIDNEDIWPGHGGSTYQLIEEERGVLEAHLAEIEKELGSLKK